jgi:dihydrofolate synthase/folylpolyglutamate synthase
VGGQLITVAGVHGSYEEFLVPLFGEHAARNAAASVVAVEALLGKALDAGAVAAALGAATAPGRIEVVRRRPLIVLDGAHNPDAAAALVEALREAFTWNRLHLVVAMFEDKAVGEVAGILGSLSDVAYATRNQSPRSASADQVAEGLRAGGVTDIETFTTVEDALQAASAHAGEDDLILVTGSFYTVGEARRLLAAGPNPPERGTERGAP